ncbi:hypothetical protein M501DRAFT_996153, partial [Patellaria atrata CBS 101060]
MGRRNLKYINNAQHRISVSSQLPNVLASANKSPSSLLLSSSLTSTKPNTKKAGSTNNPLKPNNHTIMDHDDQRLALAAIILTVTFILLIYLSINSYIQTLSSIICIGPLDCLAEYILYTWKTLLSWIGFPFDVLSIFFNIVIILIFVLCGFFTLALFSVIGYILALQLAKLKTHLFRWTWVRLRGMGRALVRVANRKMLRRAALRVFWAPADFMVYMRRRNRNEEEEEVHKQWSEGDDSFNYELMWVRDENGELFQRRRFARAPVVQDVRSNWYEPY